MFFVMVMSLIWAIVGLRIITNKIKKLKTPTESSMESIFHRHLCWQIDWNVRKHSRNFGKTYRICKNFSTKSLIEYSIKKINGDGISDSFQVFYYYYYFAGNFQFQSIFWWKMGSKSWFLGANILLTILLVYKIADKIKNIMSYFRR